MLLTKGKPHDNIYKVRESGQNKKAAVAQSVERRIGSAEVTGPIPVSSSRMKRQNPVFMRVLAFFSGEISGYTFKKRLPAG